MPAFIFWSLGQSFLGVYYVSTLVSTSASDVICLVQVTFVLHGWPSWAQTREHHQTFQCGKLKFQTEAKMIKELLMT